MRYPLPIALIVLVLLLAAGLRLHALGAQSLWNDEGNSYVQALRPFDAIAEHAARDIHPPGYYWLLKLWIGLAGETEFGLRSLSAFASLIGIACLYAVGRRLYGAPAGLMAALFAALNTFNIYYAQEARMYALLGLWAAAALLALVALMRARGRRRGAALALGLTSAAGLWTHYAFPFAMLAGGAIFAVWLAGVLGRGRRADALRGLAAYTAANLLALALFAPWLTTALAQITTWPNTGAPINAAAGLGIITGWLALGITYAAADPSWVAVALILLLFGLRHRAESWDATLAPLLWTLVPVGLFMALGLFREANLKFLLPAQIGAALWLGQGVAGLWRLDRGPRWLAPLTASAAAVALVGQMLAGLGPLYSDPAYARDDYRGIARAVEAGGFDAVVLNAPNQEEVFRYYYRGDAALYPLPAGLGGDDAAAERATLDLIDRHARIALVLWGERERDPNGIVERTLDQRAFEAESAWFGDVRLIRYASGPLPPFDPVEAVFGDSIVLEAWAVSALTAAPGDMLRIGLRWRADAPVETRYKVFLQLLDAEGRLAAGRDGEPGGGWRPTFTWEAGATVEGRHALIIPNDLPPAHYALIVGLYDSDDPGRRLAVAGRDYWILSDIHIAD